MSMSLAIRRRGIKWCHMWTDGPIEDLHLFARAIGVNKRLFHCVGGLKYYDLVPTKRALAILRGAKVLSLVVWMSKRNLEKKEERGCTTGLYSCVTKMGNGSLSVGRALLHE